MPHPRPRSLAVLGIGVVAAIATAVSGCTPIPAPTAKYVTEFGSGGGAEASGQAAASGPQWSAPAKDPLSWSDCTSQLSQRYGAPTAANGTLKCANLTVRIGENEEPARVSVTRAEIPGTPEDSAPLVLVGGTEFTSQRALTTLAAASSPLLGNRPIVAVERRGLGSSGGLTCIDAGARRVLRTGAAPSTQPLDSRIAQIGEASQAAATTCGDALPATASSYTATAAADDLEALRTAWNVPTLGLLAIGDGSNTALAYAAQHPKQIARLILDSPVRYSATELARAEDAAKGTSAAVDAFAQQCGPTCALGDDPAAAMREAIDRAATGRLGAFTDTDIRRAVVMTLGIGPGDRDARITRLADAVQGARTGNVAPLQALLRQADDALGSDGQFVARCSDASTKASPDQVKDSARSWAPQYRLGAASALELADCTAWPSLPAAPQLDQLGVRSVIATPAASPLSARSALETLTGQLTVVGANPWAITWAGIGDGAVVRAECTQRALLTYLDRAEAPTSRACPA